ncbi:hypothetical protein [Streptomyces sp. NPDC048603]|uniref:hypothetical protein n=1 Tax=Streptomyces sp. NPDC048603 TaxID=3365577 RepID=UPI0037180812
MGHLRKNSFMIYEDKNAPTEVKTLNPQEIATIEAEHQPGKKGRIDSGTSQFEQREFARGVFEI